LHACRPYQTLPTAVHTPADGWGIGKYMCAALSEQDTTRTDMFETIREIEFDVELKTVTWKWQIEELKVAII